MKENIETKDAQRTEYLDKNGLDMLWAKVKENTHNQVEVERDRATTQENRIIETKADKSELHSSYVSNSTFTALQEKVAANTDAISDKQDKIIPGNFNISALNSQNTIVALKNTIMYLISVLEKSGVITVTRS